MSGNERIDTLSKKYKIIQLRDYYSVSTDTFLLAYFSNPPKKYNKKIIELCSGSAAISILLRDKTSGNITAVEIQDKLVTLANRNIELNKIENIFVTQGDIKNINNLFSPSSFDYVVCNPPYFPIDIMPNVKSKNNHDISRHEILCNLEDIVKAIKFLLKQNGKFSLVHRSYRIADIISECQKNNLGIKRIRFVYSKKSSDKSKIVLVEGSVSNISDIIVEQPLYIYNEDGSYTEEMKRIYDIHE